MAVSEIEWPRDVAALARSLACAAGERGGWFWLDGEEAEPHGAPGRSYLGVAEEVRYAAPGREHEFLAELRADAAEWIVAFSYEFGVALMGEDPAPDDAPPAFALRVGAAVTLDHSTGSAVRRGSGELVPSSSFDGAEPEALGLRQSAHGIEWRRGDAAYLADVEACKRGIRDGEAYVLCLTDTAEASATGIDPLNLYLELRAGGPATRGAIIVAEDRALVSLSPERFLSVQGRRVTTHPIKGTRPRGETVEEDAILARELANDPKERAENLMIVDLMRNDLSRVCEPGSVAAEGFLRVERHPRVHQLVSTVSGTLREGNDVYDALEACFPGGSMTGAPKRRAVQLLAGLERGPRGLYSGCFGRIDSRGDGELAMTIRSVELRGIDTPAAEARFGAGGGITADSLPAAELAEKHLKAAPFVAVLEASATRYD